MALLWSEYTDRNMTCPRNLSSVQHSGDVVQDSECDARIRDERCGRDVSGDHERYDLPLIAGQPKGPTAVAGAACNAAALLSARSRYTPGLW